MQKHIKAFLDAEAKHFPDEQQDWAKGGIARALCDQAHWNLTSKQTKMREVQAEARDLTDPTKIPHNEVEEVAAQVKTPTEEVIATKLARKVSFYKNLEAQAAAYEKQLARLQEAHQEVTGKTWTPRQAGAKVNTAAKGVAAMLKEMGL